VISETPILETCKNPKITKTKHQNHQPTKKNERIKTYNQQNSFRSHANQNPKKFPQKAKRNEPLVKRRTELTKKKAEIGVFDGKVDGGEDRGCCLEITHFWLQMNNEQTMMILIFFFFEEIMILI